MIVGAEPIFVGEIRSSDCLACRSPRIFAVHRGLGGQKARSRSLMMRLTPPGLVFACVVTCGAFANPANATVASFTSSAAFSAAIAGSSVIVEQYATGTNGQVI